MEDDNGEYNRRRFVSTTLTGLAAVTVPSTVTAQQGRSEGEATGRDSNRRTATGIDLELVGGELQANLPRTSTTNRTVGRFYATQHDGGGPGAASTGAMEAAVEDLNRAASDGELQMYEEGGEVLVEPTTELQTVSSQSSGTGTLSTLSCGENDMGWSVGSYTNTITIKLDDANTEQLVEMTAAGSAASTIGAYIISATGVGAVPGWVAGAIGAILGYYTVDLAANNDGCGVVIEITVYASLPVPFYDMNPQ